MHCGRFHGRGDSNLITRPGLNGDRPGEVFQFNADVLSSWIVPGHSLLGEGTRTTTKYDEQGSKGCETCSVFGDGRMKVHRWIVTPRTLSAISVLESGKLLQQLYL